MTRTESLISTGLAIALVLMACAEDVPTANPRTPPPSSTSSAQAAVRSPAIGSVGLNVVSTTVINACVNNSSGTIKVVSSAECASNELLLSWNTGGSGSGITGYEVVSHQEVLPTGSWNVHVECTTGKKVLGGGFNLGITDEVSILASDPSDGFFNVIDHGWNVLAWNKGSVNRPVSAYAICAFAQ